MIGWEHKTGRRHGFPLAMALWLLCGFLAGWGRPSLASAYGEARFQHYGPVDGLPQQQVLSLHQDRAGYLWVGTYGGLGRFNGRAFTRFSTADGLASNTILSLASTPQGTLFAGTTRGLCALPAGALRFRCARTHGLDGVSIQALLLEGTDLWLATPDGLFYLREANLETLAEARLSGTAVLSLGLGADGTLLAGTPTGLLRREADGRFSALPLPGTEPHAVSSLLPDGGGWWIGTHRGLLHHDGRAAARSLELPSAVRDVPITALAVAPGGRLWATTPLGLLRREGEDFELIRSQQGLADDACYALLLDRDGGLWVGSDGGLDRLISGPLIGYTRRQGLLNDFVRTLAEDAEGRLWLGTRSGVQIVDPPTAAGWDFRRSRVLDRDDGLVDARIYAIAFDPGGQAWLATGHGIAVFDRQLRRQRLITTAEGLPGNEVRALWLDESGRSGFVGTTLGVARIEDGRVLPVASELLAQARPMRIVRDPHGRFWFATLQHGLIRLDPDGQVLRLGRDQGLSDEILWDLAVAPDGGLWVASNGDGLFHIDPDGGIRNWTQRDGLVDNFLWQLLLDRDGVLWAYTNRGLASWDGRVFRSFGTQDGLTHLEGSATAALQSRSGERWFASASGLMRYDPSRGGRALAAPITVIESVRLNGRPLPADSELAHDAGELMFEFAAPSFEHAADLRYRYRLRGLQESWSEPGPYRPITFVSLPGGRFVFEVQAGHAEGRFGPAARFPFSVRPPLWEQPWLWALGALLLAVTVWLLLRLRLRRLEARRRELEREVRERTRALEIANRRLEEASLTDPLTGLPNRRYLSRQIEADVAATLRAYQEGGTNAHRDIALLLVDIDHFKRINDQFGHHAGDAALTQFAERLKAEIRASDYVVRWGGEEFLVVARRADAPQGVQLAQRIVEAVRRQPLHLGEGLPPWPVTCSIGVTHFPPDPGRPCLLSWEQVLEVADAAVYEAKRRGRDDWVLLEPRCSAAVDAAECRRRITLLKTDLSAALEQGHAVLRCGRELAAPTSA